MKKLKVRNNLQKEKRPNFLINRKVNSMEI